ncbi:MAG: hypothetical protein LBS49_02805 [Candidatus Accumulibacter sp.]|jgi:hypothetical protein|nr:hypothetical protein [Accumulibacter sp.]
MIDNPPAASDAAQVRLTLDVTYLLNGATPAAMIACLRELGRFAFDNGLLTGETAAEVADCAIDVSLPPPAWPAPGFHAVESAIAAFLRQGIEDGQLAAEDIPTRLARYGLTDPGAFVAEMRERMDLARDDGSGEIPESVGLPAPPAPREERPGTRSLEDRALAILLARQHGPT